MKIPAVMQGRRYAPQIGDVKCPYGYHWHVGDPIEIGLEMILCSDEADRALKQMMREERRENLTNGNDEDAGQSTTTA